METLDEDDARPENHDKLIGNRTQGPALLLRQKHTPVLGHDGGSLGAEGLGCLPLGEEGEDDASVDRVFRVVAHDMLRPSVLGYKDGPLTFTLGITDESLKTPRLGKGVQGALPRKT
jgi:hypothetical protein